MRYKCIFSTVLISLLMASVSCLCFAADVLAQNTEPKNSGAEADFPDPQHYAAIFQSTSDYRYKYETVSKLLTRAKEFADHDLYAKSEELLKLYLPLTPVKYNKQELVTALAGVLVAEKKYAEAEELLLKAASDANCWEPAQVGESFGALGDFYLKRERFPEAAAAYEKALDAYDLCDGLKGYTTYEGSRELRPKYDYCLWKFNPWKLLLVSLIALTKTFLTSNNLAVFLASCSVCWLIKCTLGAQLLMRCCEGRSKKWCFVVALWVFGISTAFTLGALFQMSRAPSWSSYSIGQRLVDAEFVYLVCPLVEVLYLSFFLKRFVGFLQTLYLFVANMVAFGAGIGFYNLLGFLMGLLALVFQGTHK